MRITCFFVGKPSKSYLKEAINDYASKIRHFAEVTLIYLKDSGMNKEAKEYFTKKIKYSSFFHVVLTPEGEKLNSEELSELIRQHPDTTWFIGGPYGMLTTVKKDADFLLSFGRMTFSHGLAQVMLLEQIFRALSFIKGFPYHK